VLVTHRVSEATKYIKDVQMCIHRLQCLPLYGHFTQRLLNLIKAVL
jgi:hypothetical protein